MQWTRIKWINFLSISLAYSWANPWTKHTIDSEAVSIYNSQWSQFHENSLKEVTASAKLWNIPNIPLLCGLTWSQEQGAISKSRIQTGLKPISFAGSHHTTGHSVVQIRQFRSTSTTRCVSVIKHNPVFSSHSCPVAHTICHWSARFISCHRILTPERSSFLISDHWRSFSVTDLIIATICDVFSGDSRARQVQQPW